MKTIGSGCTLILVLINAELMSGIDERVGSSFPLVAVAGRKINPIEIFVNIFNALFFVMVNLGIWEFTGKDTFVRSLATEFAFFVLGVTLKAIAKSANGCKRHLQ